MPSTAPTGPPNSSQAAAPATQSLTRTYPDNTMIFCENEPGTELYIIQSGQVKITKIVGARMGWPDSALF